MGLAASQVTFGLLTDRKLTIGLELQRLGNTKEALTRDMQRYSREYRDALSSKKLKWSGNQGVSYTDLSYSTLMKPGVTKDNSPLLITNSNGNVVLDEQYAQYAAEIAENGGKYEKETRYNILSSLLGIPVDTLRAYDGTSQNIEDTKKAMNDADTARGNVPRKTYAVEDFIKKFLSPSALGYTSGEVLTPERATSLSSQIQQALCGKGYFSSTDEEDIAKFCSGAIGVVTDTSGTTVDNYIDGIVKSINQVSITVMIDEKNNDRGTQFDYDQANESYKQAQTAYKSAVSSNSELLNATQMNKIEYYDKLFTAIAEMGWEEDQSVSDSEYLSQTLLNNNYYITTMTKNYNYDESLDIDERNYMYSYDTEFAENDPNIFKVNDSDAQEAALAKYEYEKSLINEKEKRIDVRMKNLETEQSAIQKMLESINKVKNDNIDRTYNLWG